MQRILVVDDDPGVTNMLRRGLTYDGYMVDVAGSGEEALELARAHPPHLVVLDVMMPNMDGLQVLWRLRAEDPHLCVILLTARDAAADQVGGLEAGADDYVVKPFTFEILRARIRALLRRSEGETADVLSFGNIVLDVTKHQVWQGEREVILTAQEFKVLRVFFEQPERVMNKSMLLSRAWDPDYDGDDNIVEVYVKQLRQKLEVNGESRVIHTIRGAGYVLRAQ
ncbi:DNA-binding response regulator [Deinococcus malanensis]|uniref:DNA-binding response regulator n=1 Tax=Deinococcus malanensis TaxID=1706855 RepID=A0ABQ2ENN4_9DEIO|nr:response regulator transcription factor [Deinococcus malanensis]GGK19017.1 DNA-binding response regulator [Deinococcus malanensis]